MVASCRGESKSRPVVEDVHTKGFWGVGRPFEMRLLQPGGGMRMQQEEGGRREDKRAEQRGAREKKLVGLWAGKCCRGDFLEVAVQVRPGRRPAVLASFTTVWAGMGLGAATTRAQGHRPQTGQEHQNLAGTAKAKDQAERCCECGRRQIQWLFVLVNHSLLYKEQRVLACVDIKAGGAKHFERSKKHFESYFVHDMMAH